MASGAILGDEGSYGLIELPVKLRLGGAESVNGRTGGNDQKSYETHQPSIIFPDANILTAANIKWPAMQIPAMVSTSNFALRGMAAGRTAGTSYQRYSHKEGGFEGRVVTE